VCGVRAAASGVRAAASGEFMTNLIKSWNDATHDASFEIDGEVYTLQLASYKTFQLVSTLLDAAYALGYKSPPGCLTK
jgi:hypothetical protein